MTVINIQCEECGGVLEVDGSVTEIGDTRTVTCTECGWQTEATRVPLSEMFGPKLDWELCSIRRDSSANELRVVFDVKEVVDNHRVVARCTYDGEFVAWEPSAPEDDERFLRDRAIEAAERFDTSWWS